MDNDCINLLLYDLKASDYLNINCFKKIQNQLNLDKFKFSPKTILKIVVSFYTNETLKIKSLKHGS